MLKLNYIITFLAGAICGALLALFAQNVKACDGVFLSAHVGSNINLFTTGETWVGDVPVSFAIGHRWKQQDNFYWELKLVHDSNLDKGWPVNDEFETARDVIYGGFTWYPN